MNKTIFVLFLFVNNLFASSWLEKYYGITNVTSIEIFKNESIKCEHGGKGIVCKTELDKNDIKIIKNAEYFISDTLQDFYYQEPYRSGFMIINNIKVIKFYDSFRVPCTKNDSIVKIVGKINEKLKYFKSKYICSMLKRIYWKEITENEYYTRRKLEPYIKPNYNKSIDSLFPEKGKYEIGKKIDSDGDCEKGRNQIRIN